MSLAKCYLKRQIPKIIKSEDITGIGNTAIAVMLNLVVFLGRGKHSQAEVVQTGFPHMVNIYADMGLVDIWE